MTIQNSSTDTTANAAGIPTTYAEDNKDMVIEDITDIEKPTVTLFSNKLLLPKIRLRVVVAIQGEEMIMSSL